MTKILLVEDDKSLREIYGVRLLAEGYDIVSAGDGEEALAMAIKERPQLIVSDVMMPKISGFDMLDILRSTTETKDIKVIMMTALSSEDQRARGEALGADRYLVKSQVGIEDVVRTVHDVLGDAPVATPGATSFTSPAPTDRSATPTVPPRQPAPTYQTPTAAPAPGGLPQPTAPFSTPRPANLGDRVIHPMPQEPNSKPDLGSLIDQELGNSAPVPPAPTMPAAAPAPVAMPVPTAPVAPQQPAMPQAPTAAPMTPPSVPPAPVNTTQPPAPTAY
jgi:CheY-like chemotaxis protein